MRPLAFALVFPALTLSTALPARAAEPAPKAAARAAKASDQVMVHDPFVRLSPGGGPNAGAFGHVMNHSASDHAIVKAASPVAKTVELHTHVEENGVFRMRPVERIEVKANGSAKLEPGGLHIMLLGLVKPLAEGQKVPITLTFEDGSTTSFEAEVKKLPGMMGAPGQGPDGHGHGHHQ